MRGGDEQQGGMWSYISPEERVPQDHPLRPIREMVNVVLKDMSPTFSRIYSRHGRPSIPPEHLLRALLLQVLYSVRSERMLMEQLDYNLLFRWFVGLNMDDAVWSATTFSKNRERLIDAAIADKFFERVLIVAREAGFLSNEHFTVDGTLIEAWAGHKSFKPKDSGGDDPDDRGNPTVDFRGQKRTNDTHRSTTDPEARLYRKSHGTESKLCFAGHVLMDNRYGLVVDRRLTEATSRSERDAGLEMAEGLAFRNRATLGADKGYDTADFVEGLRDLEITPHVAAKVRHSAVDGRTTRHGGYAISQRKRKQVEEIFGWLKTIALLRKTRHRGKRRVGWMFCFALAAYNLIRMRNLAWGTP
jgi:transposase